jgi:5'-nucleotidase
MKKELVYEAKEKAYEKKVRIIHFNDAYNIESRKVEPCGGASRFVTAIEELNRDEPAIVLFSGDVFSPSTRELAAFC